MSARFKGLKVLVTGANGGIGKAIIERFRLEQASIIATDISKFGDSSIPSIVGDLTDNQFCDQLPLRAFEQAGGLDIVINNAGIIRRGNILNTNDKDWQLSMQINVNAIFHICRSAVAIMQKHGGGTIVNTASCWGLYPGPDHIAYCTSKAAVAAFTQCLGRDHANDGIRANAVCPNEVNTPMLRSGFEMRGFDPESAVNELGKTVPLGRIAEAEDIADAIAFLASDESRYITGTTLEVNGGKAVY